MDKFIAKYQYGEPSLYKVTVVKETEKTLFIEKPVKIMGWIYLPNRISKGSYSIFDTHLESVRWLASKSGQHIVELKEQIEKERATFDYLNRLSYEIETGKTNEAEGERSERCRLIAGEVCWKVR